MSNEQLVLVRLTDGNQGTHGVIGPQTKRNYGYRRDGDTFYVLQADVAVLERVGQVKYADTKAPLQPELSAQASVEAKVEVEAEDHPLLAMSGINAERLMSLQEKGIDNYEALAKADSAELAEILGTSPSVATRIINEAKRNLE